MHVSVDLGFGYVKALSEDGRRLCFPSVVAPAPRSLGFTGAASSTGAGYHLSIGREQVLIGEAAMAVGGTRGLSEVAANRPGVRTLLLAALRILCGQTPGPLDVLLGLPLAVYANAEERRGLISAFGGLTETVEGHPVRIGRVDVYPQGAGAYFAAAARLPELRGGLTGIVDVGTWTSDYLVISADGGLTVREGSWGSIAAGMAEVVRHVVQDLAARLGRPADPLRIEAALRDGQVYRHQGQPIDLRDSLRRAGGAVVEGIVSALQDAWRRDLPAIDRVLLTGGGALQLGDQFGALHPRVGLAPDPQWGNAEGYLVLRRSAAKTGVA